MITGVLTNGVNNIAKTQSTDSEVQAGFLDMLLSVFSGKSSSMLVGEDGNAEQRLTEVKDSDVSLDITDENCYGFIGIVPNTIRSEEIVVEAIAEKCSITGDSISGSVKSKISGAVNTETEADLVTISSNATNYPLRNNTESEVTEFEASESNPAVTEIETKNSKENPTQDVEIPRTIITQKKALAVTAENSAVSKDYEFQTKKTVTPVIEGKKAILKSTSESVLVSNTSNNSESLKNVQSVQISSEGIKLKPKEQESIEKEISVKSSKTTKEVTDFNVMSSEKTSVNLKELTFEKSESANKITVNPKEIVPQLSKAIETEAGKGTDCTFKMKLKPDGLGEVTVEMKNEAGKLEIVIKTELSATKELINKGIDLLRTELTSENKKIDYQLTSLTVEQETNNFNPMFSHGQFTRGDEGTHSRNEQSFNINENQFESATDSYETKTVRIASYRLGQIDYLA